VRAVRKLPPAHTLVYENGRVRIARYWRLDYGTERQVSLDEALEEFGGLLDEATKLRMTADRPIGAFLSGGIDSSLVVAAMSASGSPSRATTSARTRAPSPRGSVPTITSWSSGTTSPM
jgi:asparagine synthetase B (glutamine-hydrolysing)